MRRLIVPAVAVAGIALTAQTPEPQRFLARADVVSVDVSVLDRNRQPVRDLTAADFTILEDGRAQSIEYFRHIDLPAPAATTTAWRREVAPDVVRNEEIVDRRLIVIVMDDAMIPFDVQIVNSAKHIARDVVERLGPADLAAVLFTYDNRRTQNFTRDRARLLAAIDSFSSAGFEPRPGVEKQPLPYYRAALNALFGIVDTLSLVAERRKAIVYISTGVPVVVDSPETTLSDQPLFNWLLRQTSLRAQRGSINIYAVDPGGLDGLRGYMLRRETQNVPHVREQIEQAPALYRYFLRDLAETTGGRAFTNSNEFTSRIDQIFLETGTFYLLGYQSQNTRADGRFRRLQVRVNRPGVTVVARRGYYAPQPANMADRGRPPAETLTAIAGLVPKTDVPLELTAAPFAVPGRTEAAMVLALGVRPAGGEGASAADTVDVFLQGFTPQGEARASTRVTANVAGRTGEEPAASYEVLARLDVPPGRYEIRASAASAATSRSGSVYGYVEIPDFVREPLSLSGLVLAVDPATDGGPKDLFQNLLPIVPTTRRTFAAGDRVTAFLRVYQGGNAALEPVEITTRILDGTGATVLDQPRTIGADAFGTARQADHLVVVPVDRLAAGPHLLRLTATAGRHVVRRDVPFHVR